jgi:hypothetical protein
MDGPELEHNRNRLTGSEHNGNSKRLFRNRRIGLKERRGTEAEDNETAMPIFRNAIVGDD